MDHHFENSHQNSPPNIAKSSSNIPSFIMSFNSNITVKAEPADPGFEDDVSLSPSSPPEEDGNIKSEFKSNGGVKDEDDEDNYEDNLDLDTSRIDSKVWLVRLPKFLMEKWKDIDRVGGKELGKVRIQTQNRSSDPWKVKLVLNDNADTADIPHNYDISMLKQEVSNTFVFTEKDLPDYEPKSSGGGGGGVGGSSAGVPGTSGSGGNADQSTSKTSTSGTSGPVGTGSRFGQRYTPYIKTIPKQTALVGTVYHECQVIPSLSDKNYNQVVNQRRILASSEPRAKVTLLTDLPGVTSSTFGASLRGNKSVFMQAQRSNAKSSSDGKAIRIPRNELLDLLFKLFEEYDYWSMKGLRERTKQPESYLKEVLEPLAVLIKKGPYAMKYSLKPEFKQIKGLEGSLSAYMEKTSTGNNNKQTETPSTIANDGSTSNVPISNEDDDDDDDDDDIEMETII